jgi:D-tyrosyl-tRNA(Tyr) deacylase
VRAVLQRAARASVTVNNETVSQFDRQGIVALVGVTHGDDQNDVDTIVRKIAELVEAVVAGLRERGLTVGTGVFGAHMDVELVNDGPVTIIVDS